MSATRKPSFGSFAGIQDNAVKAALNQIKEVIESNLGLRGDSLDANPTWRELVDSGLVTLGRNEFIASETITNPGSGSNDPDFDSAIPPAPEGVAAEGGYSVVYIVWDDPPFANLAYTEVWRSATDDLGTAVKIGNSNGTTPFFVDATGLNSGIHYYWVRFVSVWGGIVGPYNATAGTPGESAIDPQYIIDQLSGQITRTELAASLNTELDTNASDIATVALDVVSLDADVVAINSTISVNGAAIAQETSIRTSETGELYAQYTVKIDAGGLVSGYGLASETVNGTTISSFIIHANNFAVGFPGQADAYPFVIGTVNGATAIGMNAATYIIDLTVTDAKIEAVHADKLFVTTGTLATAIIGTAEITNAMIGNIIRSDNYSAGSAGWIVNKNGTAEFRNITARGDIEASSLKADSLEIVKEGHIEEASVSTLKIQNNAVTIPVSAYIPSSNHIALPPEFAFSSSSQFSQIRVSTGFTTPPTLGASQNLTAFVFGYAYTGSYPSTALGINANYMDKRYAVEENTGNGTSGIEGRAFLGLELYNHTNGTSQFPWFVLFGYGSAGDFSRAYTFSLNANTSYTLRGYYDSTNPNIESVDSITLYGSISKK